MRDGRIPERGPNGGDYPGYHHFNEGETPSLPPDPRRKRQMIALIVATLSLLVVCGLGVWVMESGGKRAASALRANSAGAPVIYASPSSADPSAPSLLGMDLGFCALDSDKLGAQKVCVYKVVRADECANGVKPAKGHEFLLILIRATVTRGVVDVNPNDWSFTPSADHTPAPMSWAYCQASAGFGLWPGEDGMRPGQSIYGFMGYEVAAGSGGTFAYLPDHAHTLASWKIPRQ